MLLAHGAEETACFGTDCRTFSLISSSWLQPWDLQPAAYPGSPAEFLQASEGLLLLPFTCVSYFPKLSPPF